eukprot:634102-Prorocentrum_minimum.AAC.3
MSSSTPFSNLALTPSLTLPLTPSWSFRPREAGPPSCPTRVLMLCRPPLLGSPSSTPPTALTWTPSLTAFLAAVLTASLAASLTPSSTP